MPCCYPKDPKHAHGTRHHVYLNVDFEEDHTECVCGEVTLGTYALAPLQEAKGDHETAREWFDTTDVNEECADEARDKLGITRDLTELEPVTPRRAHILQRCGLGSHYAIRTMPTRVMAAPTGFDKDVVERIREAAGGRYPEYHEEWEVIPEL